MKSRALVPSRLAAMILALSALTTTTPAQADAPADEQRTIVAQTLFDEARRLTNAGSFAEACPRFAESHRLDPSMGTRFYLADCLEHIGKLASAWTHFRAVADEARVAGQKERAEFAAERAAAVEPRITRLTLVVSAGARSSPRLAITHDGVTVDETQWGVALPVDPGDHLVAASASGKLRWERRVSVSGEGKTITVEVPPLLDAPPPSEAPAKPSFLHSPLRIAGLSLGAAGLVALGVGAGFGAQAMSRQQESNAAGRCDANDVCDRAGYELRGQSISAATISTVGFVAGGVLLAGGAALVLAAPRASSKESGLAAPRLAVGPGSLVISGSF